MENILLQALIFVAVRLKMGLCTCKFKRTVNIFVKQTCKQYVLFMEWFHELSFSYMRSGVGRAMSKQRRHIDDRILYFLKDFSLRVFFFCKCSCTVLCIGKQVPCFFVCLLCEKEQGVQEVLVYMRACGRS